MASADLSDELKCSICLKMYIDPVTLTCGHNFCRVCIDCALDAQNESGVYTCPDCRNIFIYRPVLQKNITLRSIAEHFRFPFKEEGETGIFCTYCDFPVLANKTCLQCETSMCDRHLRKHNKSVEHILISPTIHLGNKKCFIHKKILEYYCTEDNSCICVSCCLTGEHRGHQVESLDEASEKKKEKLRNIFKELITRRVETEKSIHSLQESKRGIHKKATGERQKIIALFRDMRRQLKDIEKKVLSEISRQEEEVSLPVSDLIQQLGIKKEELSRKMRHIEELCNATDPVTVLQEPEGGDFCDSKDGDNEDRERHEKQVQDVGHFNVGLISKTLHTLSDTVRGVNVRFYMQEPTGLLLDVNTAGSNVNILGDLKTAFWTHIKQNRPEKAERFQNYQVLSTSNFSSGSHYWDVEISKSGNFRVGMCYPSIDRRGNQSDIGDNNKSWCLYRNCYNQYSVVHDSKVIQLPHNISCHRVRIYLDYKAGQLSFYALCDPIRHLHTFTAAFTEPLHAVLWVGRDCSIKISWRHYWEVETSESENWREEQASLLLSNITVQLEAKKDELSKQMCHIEELCNMTDSVSVLQEPDISDAEVGDNEDRERYDKQVHEIADLDEGLISVTLQKDVSDNMTTLKNEVYVKENYFIVLDEDTAGNRVVVSSDMKTVSFSEESQNRPETLERFEHSQVLSTRSFSSGRHYWELETSESGSWAVGVAYPSIDRKGENSFIGDNNKSSGLCACYNQYSVMHGSKESQLANTFSCHRIGIYLDYEGGRLSFYELCDPIRHLHTITTTFTEPLHAAFYVWDAWLKIRS
ncbi:LOW QUALITY PROTEIN: E3 ubiquitin-protein ligase TRIM39-like [Mixophyes fleayi]|uniref:LOW QUALITY PROTEIN: E3 ubiquitin-protein ligase TRIM39-like n=1 Tax=Mixophyes fleayi TaxID=3061075 RepID=UPI003F4DFD0A